MLLEITYTDGSAYEYFGVYYNFLKEETAREPYLSLSAYLNKIELLKSNNLGLKLNKIIPFIPSL